MRLGVDRRRVEDDSGAITCVTALAERRNGKLALLGVEAAVDADAGRDGDRFVVGLARDADRGQAVRAGDVDAAGDRDGRVLARAGAGHAAERRGDEDALGDDAVGPVAVVVGVAGIDRIGVRDLVAGVFASADAGRRDSRRDPRFRPGRSSRIARFRRPSRRCPASRRWRRPTIRRRCHRRCRPYPQRSRCPTRRRLRTRPTFQRRPPLPEPARDEPPDPPRPLPVPPATGVTSPQPNASAASAIVSRAPNLFIGLRHASAERRRFMKRPISRPQRTH